ncbi:hypothetical protein F4778DRAFT_117456 [Xylariomycetidae sp. FL2044]|nr:hypothetical protein F4778DRAFT_117456 [Xylariomycetidae sp. FL2044]
MQRMMVMRQRTQRFVLFLYPLHSRHCAVPRGQERLQHTTNQTLSGGLTSSDDDVRKSTKGPGSPQGGSPGEPPSTHITTKLHAVPGLEALFHCCHELRESHQGLKAGLLHAAHATQMVQLVRVRAKARK